ncbi:Fe2+-dependent dioxygenase [Alteraurantiacibacter aquimixticola]|uniref:Fe2+-dependent dioxygenase n=1 Tax=Alteraurantiacibacter aquimixticola TaxID=2489173 RepID=A0A4T3F051_9SPHN|nr:Fe2+-dependent dioxygenase [Alteraurantiacibacter aquimixticola]TIX49814.1 Fe2+-dependent dioxygenase [Alteraurantiacibacter aquimixticola]
MILSIAAIPDPDEVRQLQEKIARLSWVDGRASAGKAAQAVKRNEQAIMKDDAGLAVRQVILPHIVENATLRAAARPRRFSHLMISKTRDGGGYGPHVDNAIMGQDDARMLTDLSFTLFLTSPQDYEGGELVVHGTGGTQSLKAEAGHLVLYPSSTIHEVRPVTRGERIVCIGWIESMIADLAQRELLFDLQTTRSALHAALPAGSAELLKLDKTIANLLRMWARA